MRAHIFSALVLSVVAILVEGCSSSNTNKNGAETCKPGDTRTCVGPGQCPGAQTCGAAKEWSVCDCGATGGTGGGAGSVSGGAGGTSSGGVGAGGAGGVAGAGGGGVGGVGGMGGGTGGATADGGTCSVPNDGGPLSADDMMACIACCDGTDPKLQAAVDACLCTGTCSGDCECPSGTLNPSTACGGCLQVYLGTINSCIKSACNGDGGTDGCEMGAQCFAICTGAK